MSDSDKLFAGSIPALYDQLLVPLIFRSCAEDLAARAVAAAPSDVLEVAAGTGVVARAMARRAGPDLRYVATDLNAPMLDLAKQGLAGDPRFGWQTADALALPFPDRSFDLVLCQFGVMFFPDRVAGYREALRVLRPGGRFLFNSWDSLARNAFADCVFRATAALFPDDPPRFFERTPHGYHDPDQIRSDLRAAGFGSVDIEPFEAVATAETAGTVATAYCQGTPLRRELEARGALEAATEHVARAIAAEFGPGPVVGEIRALVVTAT